MDRESLLREIASLEFKELIRLYIEAITGDDSSIEDLLPPETLEAINNLKKDIFLDEME